MFGKRTYVIFLKSIAGIYRYKAQLVGILKFRRTFRLHSALDKRPVWTVAYQLTDANGKDINQRVYAKFSPEMLDFLSALVPGKVKIPEKKVIAEVISKESTK